MREYIIEILNGTEELISRIRDVVTGEYEQKIKERAYINCELEAYEMELNASLMGNNIQSFRWHKRAKERCKDAHML